MKLYLLHWDGWSYDTYSDAVVVASSEEKASQIHPLNQDSWKNTASGRTWCKTPKDVTSVTYIGKAASNLNEGDVVCASFQAG